MTTVYPSFAPSYGETGGDLKINEKTNLFALIENEHRPFQNSNNLRRREDDGMERHVIFRHELEQLDFVGIFPPRLPSVASVIGGDAQITDRGVEPNVEN